MTSNSQIYEACEELMQMIDGSFQDPSQFNHDFTPGFLRKMKCVIRKSRYPVLYSAMQHAACILLIITLAWGFILSVSPEARAAVTGWIRSQFDFLERYSYFGPHVPEGNQIDFVLDYVPEGYVFYSETKANGKTTIRYQKESTGQILHFHYTQKPADYSHYFSREQQTLQEIIIDGTLVDYYASTDNSSANRICWKDPDTNTFFYISIHEPFDELRKIFINLKISES